MASTQKGKIENLTNLASGSGKSELKQIPKTRSHKEYSVLPQACQNNFIRPSNLLIQDYILHNLADSQTLALRPGVASIQYMSDSTYIGELVSGEASHKKQGRGVYKYSNSDVYLGDWHDDIFNGLGMYIFANGDIYQGLFQNGESTKGIMIYSDGSIYQGTVKDGFRDGFGTIICLTENKQLEFGWKYTGEWRKNFENGQGVYICQNYEIRGTWEDGKVNGDVIIKQRDLGKDQKGILNYQGLMSEDELIKGEGKINFGEKNWYAGEIFHGKLEGNGHYEQVTEDNCRLEYEGHFKLGLPQGLGTLKMISKNKGQPDSLTYLYSGQVKRGKAEGKGKISYFNGDVYQGDIFEGFKSGQGRYNFRNGDVYEGQFKRDKMEGNGTYFWGNVTLCYSGYFENNRIVIGKGQFINLAYVNKKATI